MFERSPYEVTRWPAINIRSIDRVQRTLVTATNASIILYVLCSGHYLTLGVVKTRAISTSAMTLEKDLLTRISLSTPLGFACVEGVPNNSTS